MAKTQSYKYIATQGSLEFVAPEDWELVDIKYNALTAPFTPHLWIFKTPLIEENTDGIQSNDND